MSAGPVFIGGLAYSGKTPLRIALGLHPDLTMTRKSRLWDRLDGRFGGLAEPANLERCLAALRTDEDAARLEPDPETLRAAFVQGPATYPRLFGLVHAQHADRRGTPRWGEQFGPIPRHARALVDTFPGARMLHLVRDPRDRYAASPHRGPAALVREAARWREDARLARANVVAHPGNVSIVRYEDLAADPVGMLERVCTWVDLEPTEAMRASIADAFDREGTPVRRRGPAARVDRQGLRSRGARPGLHERPGTPRCGRCRVSGRGPVYVAGLERSGTSLMFALLASHPSLAMTRRTNLWRHIFEQYGDLAEDANLDRCLDTMRRYKRLVGLGTDWERLRADLCAGPRTYPRLFDLLHEQHAERMGRPRWGDKSLHTERWAAQIVAADPDARILHMIRDPRDRFASSVTRWKVRRGGVGAGAAEWRSSARIALENERRFPAQCRAVRYESLATEPERTLRDLCAFIGEDFDPAMLGMDGAPAVRDGGNSSYGRLADGAISTSSIGRFAQILTPRQIAFLQRATRSEMRAFGYEPVVPGLSGRDRLAFVLRDLPVESAHMVAWRLRERRRDRVGRPLRPERLVEPEPAEEPAR
jgi:hypothetical protein